MKLLTAPLALLSLILFGKEDEVEGFCPVQEQQRFGCSLSSSSLSLFPGQGNQLAAAYTVFLSHVEEEKDDTPTAKKNRSVSSEMMKDNEPHSSSSHWRALAASRSFVQRVFHLPSSSIKKHPYPTLEGLKEQHQRQSSPTFPFHFLPRHPSAQQQQQHRRQEDYVLYPLVGFHFVKCRGLDGSTERTIVLPTTSHASCHLPTNRHEVVYGWFSPACKLDLYAEDVCHAPTTP